MSVGVDGIGPLGEWEGLVDSVCASGWEWSIVSVVVGRIGLYCL